MKNKFFLVFIILAVFVTESLYGNASDNSDPIIGAKTIAENLTKLNTSLNIVLAIDSSASIYYESQSSKSTAIEFLKTIENKTNTRIKIGYVSWRHVPVFSSSYLSSNFSDIYHRINDTNFTGNTCFRNGLNRSLELLRKEATSAVYNVLIIISDGEENCNTESNFTCDEFNKMNSTDIYIYTIQIGRSDKGSSLLKCLEKPIEKPIGIPELPHPNPSALNGSSSNKPGNKMLKPISIFEKAFQFQTQGSEVSIREPNTNMSVSKSITGGIFGPKITLKLAAPGIEAIKTGIVIAIDSSGSLGKGGRAEYGYNIRMSMQKILDKIDERMPKSNISIVSWDDNVDFAYSPLLNNNPLLASLVPISQAKSEIYEKEVFLYKSSYPFPLNFIAGVFPSNVPGTYYYCNETESTNLSVGLESARIILNKTVGNKLDATRKLILLVTSRSEFSRCDKDIVNKAKNENCNIHTIGIGVIDGSELQKDLIEIAGDKNKPEGDREKYHYSPGSSLFNEATVATSVNQALEQYSTENISNKISIVDTLYPYIHLVEGQSIKVMLNDNILNESLYTKTVTINSDNTTTLEIILDKNVVMIPSDVIQVSFDTYLDLSLPIEATNSRTSRIYSINQKTPTSHVSYSWLGNNLAYNIPLPECNIALN